VNPKVLIFLNPSKDCNIMKTVITIGRAKFTACCPALTFENMHLTEEQRLALRVSEITLLANKKHRKPRLSGEKRIYPRDGANLSAREYIAQYYRANFPNATVNAGDSDIVSFFAPLSPRINQSIGEYSEEVTQ
jgi:hypothetical protein